ncbi:uncharacterized protein CIMG_06259 [Coccidioides immitis RS]|uniref:Uncharacterized protein n=3 Tax=Coccidioides immitis TaxID=5501 RepID=J3K7S3_COCIM|nr:uncharacterized protein CIMG_06259 [Coccidioides immitis RS]EAS30780.3 hypothetical protein CIMG_06259 [Coccidioides immitis RS]KMP03361.1 hypothetical protein CIRG_03053 [Coccidioides immitis RMSCC 2394]KMU73900.1 hypothetical protein CISG_03878 [Coccidioides immitis RMSCC 3703]TPX23678.1 hypothetical protein DIZ76_013014 [Coccidioides immitis]
MPMTWNAQADARLLLAIIKTSPKIDLKAVVKHMGNECTEKALRHRIGRLQSLAAGDGETSAPTTPTKSPKTPKTRAPVLRATHSSSAGKRKATMKTDDEPEVKKEGETKKLKVEEDYEDLDFA